MSDFIAVFDSAPVQVGDLVLRTGKIFECGDYPDKDFALTPEEADAAIAAFTPVELELEHFTTEERHHILEGGLGRVARLWRNGTALMGTVEVPTFIDGLWSRHGRKISAAWDKTTKALTRAGLVLEPRITDAALYAAFAGARHSTGDQTALNAAHDAIVAAGASNCPASAKDSMMSEEPRKDPTILDQFVAFMKGQSGATAGAPPPAPDPAIAALQAQLETQRAALAAQTAAFAAEQAASRLRDATAFVDAQITAQRLPPFTRGLFVATLAQAMADDAATPAQVTFTNATGGTGAASRADVTRAALLALPVTAFAGLGTFTPAPGQTLNFVPGVDSAPPPDPNAPMTDDRRIALLAESEAGRAVLAARTNGKGGH